jgi:hypothetical protein
MEYLPAALLIYGWDAKIHWSIQSHALQWSNYLPPTAPLLLHFHPKSLLEGSQVEDLY